MQTLGQPILGKVTGGEIREKEERRYKNAVNSGHCVPSATAKGSAHTLLGPKNHLVLN